MSKSIQLNSRRTIRQGALSRRRAAARANLLAQCAGLEQLEDRLLMSGNTYDVITTADNTNTIITGSLRWAINQANANPGSTIDFKIAGGGMQTLTVAGALPALSSSVTIDGTTEGGYAGSPLIVLDGSSASFDADGLDLNADNSAIKGLAIDNFGGSAIAIGNNSNDIIVGNYLGVDTTSQNYASNGLGLSASGATNLTVMGNVISGNFGDGIYLYSVSGSTLITGNFIGTDSTGTIAVSNFGNGINLDGSTGVTVGGNTAAARNIISGNFGDGVHIDGGSANIVEGNYIGTDATGSTTNDIDGDLLGNEGSGVNILDLSYNNVIGGSTAAQGNVISGSLGDNVLIITASPTPIYNLIEGNYIGTDATGKIALDNYGNGIDVGSSGSTISGNVISGNAAFGILLGGSYTDIHGNWIGVDQQGDALGNQADGIWVTGSNNLIGGMSPGQGNIIANNDGNGVTVLDGMGNAIRGNSIFSNTALGIDLGNDGVTVNDSQGHNSGPNFYQDFPLLSMASISGATMTISGTAYGAPLSSFTVDFFANDPALAGSVQGQTYLGQISVTTDASGQASFTALLAAPAVGSKMTSTETDSAGNTSEFSADITSVQVAQASTTTTLSSSLNPAPFGQDVTFTATVHTASGHPSGSVLFMDGSSVLGSGTVDDNGVATFTTSALSVGGHTITAVYGGDAGYTGSTSAPLSESITPLATSTTISSSLNPSTFSQSVTFTAAVTGNGSPTGSVLFMDGNTVLGSANLVNGVATFTTSAFAVGGHTITAQYSGDDDFTASSDSLVQTVNQLPTTTTLTSSADPSNWGDSVTFTATVTSTLTPTGTVLFMCGNTVLGSGTLVNGVATFTTSSLPVGADAITAVYQGDTDFAMSSSAPLSEVVNPLATFTMLSSSVNPANYGQSITFTAAVTGNGSPSGSVLFMDGSTVLGSGTLVNGVATFTTSSLSVGGHTITAAYSGDADFTTSTSAPLTQTVSALATTTTLGSSLNPANYGQSVTFTASVTGNGSPSGSVLFMDGSTVLGSGTLVNGVATFTTSSLSVGGHTITAAYSGDADFTASASAPLTQTVTAMATTTTLGSSLNPANYGQSVTFTATVAGNGSPTGSVLFMDGSTVLGSGTLVNGVATFTTSALTVGGHTITAAYSGDADDTASVSAPLTQTVTALATTTTLGSSLNPANYGQSVTFTATVAGSGLPSGSVLFMDGSTVLGSCTLVNGVATFTTSSLSVGGHTVTAAYSGDTNNTASSAGLTQTVSPLATTTTLSTSVNPANYGQTVVFTATVSGSPTGSVLFMDGSTILGSGALVNGMASLSTSMLSVGGHTITAVYQGSANYAGSTSAPLTETINALATSTTITSSANPSTYGQSVTFTAAVSGSGTPTGTVTFMDGSTVLGTGTLSHGVATFTTSALSAGSHNITAVYGGAATFAASSSTPLAQCVNAATATITGHTYLDRSGDGLSSDDLKLVGVTVNVYLDKNGNNTLDAGDGAPVATMASDNSGAFSFASLPAGRYFVQEVVPAGYIQTAPYFPADYYTVNAVGGASYGSNDFDNFQKVTCDITNVKYTINGGSTCYTSLGGNVHQGDTVKVTFTVPAGQTETYSLVSYTCPDSVFYASDADQQQIYYDNYGTFTGGTHTLTVVVPKCYFQIDFVCGLAIDKFGASGSNDFYSAQSRLVSSCNGGTSPQLLFPPGSSGTIIKSS